MKLKHIPLEKIITKDNVRSERDGELADLMESIEEHDLIEPITVTPKGEKYVVVVGHRRFAAMKARNEATVPCIIRTDISDADRPWIQLVENSQRKQMAASEYVEVFERMKEAMPGLTHGKIAKMIGRSPSWVRTQYEAAKLAGVLVTEGEAKPAEARKMTAGQIKSRAQRMGIGAKGRRQTGDLSVQCVSSTTINVRTRDVTVTGRVLQALDVLREEIRKEG